MAVEKIPEFRDFHTITEMYNKIEFSPKSIGSVELICIRPKEGERIELESVEVNEDVGVMGDNWELRGSRHTKDGTAHPEMQITFMNSRIINLIAGDVKYWHLAGDQFFVDFDLTRENLPVGSRIQIGETAIFEITQMPHNGCHKFSKRYGSDATKFVNNLEGKELRRRGVNAKVVQAGLIKIGDRITKISS
jgi:hypothetical protein